MNINNDSDWKNLKTSNEKKLNQYPKRSLTGLITMSSEKIAEEIQVPLDAQIAGATNVAPDDKGATIELETAPKDNDDNNKVTGNKNNKDKTSETDVKTDSYTGVQGKANNSNDNDDDNVDDNVDDNGNENENENENDKDVDDESDNDTTWFAKYILGDSNVEDEEEARDYGEFFGGSTHRELLYFDRTRSPGDLFVAASVIISQWFLYGVFFDYAIDSINKDMIPLTIQFQNCEYGRLRYTCELNHPTSAGYFGQIFLPGALITAYTLGDLRESWHILTQARTLKKKEKAKEKRKKTLKEQSIGSTASIGSESDLNTNGYNNNCCCDCDRCSRRCKRESCLFRITAGIMIITTLFGILVACTWAVAGNWSGSQYDAIINCVGILFVHDMDEQVFRALGYDKITKILRGRRLNKEGFGRFKNLMAAFVYISAAIFYIPVFIRLNDNRYDGTEMNDTVFCIDGQSYLDGEYASGNNDTCPNDSSDYNYNETSTLNGTGQ